ncbi:Per1-like protein, partial [Dacryopinax primogenitus]
ASSGDRSPAFQSCLTDCTSLCTSPSAPPLPVALRLTLWSCADDCRYTCMHAVEAQKSGSGSGSGGGSGGKDGRKEQYYGKWPFRRFLGAQEPISVLASVANGYMHIRGLRLVRRRLHANSPVPAHAHANAHAGAHPSPLRKYMEWYAYLGVNAWFCSCIFHTRDTPLTEKFDYFSAALVLLYSLFYTLIRLLHLYTPARRAWRLRLAAGLGLVFGAHVSYLSWLPKVVRGLPRFDYGYNMRFCLFLGVAHNFLWLLATYLPRTSPFPGHTLPFTIFPPPLVKRSWKPLAFVLLTMSTMSLELLDFPPLMGLMDAHAAWHCATVPIVGFWYAWLVRDA